jgi:hypothetical protein
MPKKIKFDYVDAYGKTIELHVSLTEDGGYFEKGVGGGYDWRGIIGDLVVEIRALEQQIEDDALELKDTMERMGD